MADRFEEKIKQLEDIVAKLESGELSLDNAVELYTKGVNLSAECKKTLDEANLKITQAKSEK